MPDEQVVFGVFVGMSILYVAGATLGNAWRGRGDDPEPVDVTDVVASWGIKPVVKPAYREGYEVRNYPGDDNLDVATMELLAEAFDTVRIVASDYRRCERCESLLTTISYVGFGTVDGDLFPRMHSVCNEETCRHESFQHVYPWAAAAISFDDSMEEIATYQDAHRLDES